MHFVDFWFSEKIVALSSLFVLDLANRTNIIAPSSSGEGRVMTVHHDAGLDAVAATMPGLEGFADYGWNVREPRKKKAIDAGAPGGRSKCMSGRQSARTRHVSAKATIPGDMQQAAKSIRVRNAGVKLRSRLFVTTCAARRTGHVLVTWRRGRGETPCRSARPFGEIEEQDDRRALGPD